MNGLTQILEQSEAERLATGFVFTEGPLWHPDGFYYFVDVRASKFYRLKPGGAAELLRENTGEGNGTPLDPQGRLVICEGGNRRLTRWPADGKFATSEMLIDRFDGKRLNRPNDLCCKSDGSIYFTDPGAAGAARRARAGDGGGHPRQAGRFGQQGGRFRIPERAGLLAGRAGALCREYEVRNVHPRDRAGRGRQHAAPADLRQHVLGRDRGRAGRDEGRRRGKGLLHRAGRHLGIRALGREARGDPHPGGAGQSVLRRPRYEDAVLYRTHLDLFDAGKGAGGAGAPVSALTGSDPSNISDHTGESRYPPVRRTDSG